MREKVEKFGRMRMFGKGEGMKQLKRIYNQYYNLITRVVFPVVLFLYSFWNVNHGVDVSDSTYSLANFLFFEEMEGMWVVSTYVANVVGWILTKLPFGTTLLGMNIYTTLLVSATVLLVYYMLWKWIPAWIVFVGEVIAIGFCWIPTGILYNYLTYFFFTLGAIWLYQGLVEEKDKYLVMAGVSLGINVFVRIPNLAEMALIVGLWYYLGMKKQKFSRIAGKTGWCLAGYLLGVAIPLVCVLIQFGVTGIVDMVLGLSSIQSGDETYSVLSMFTMTLDAYKRTLKWVGLIGVFTLMGMAVFFCLKKIKKNYYLVYKVCQVLYVAGIAVLLRFLWGRGMYSFRYYEDYSSMYEWGMIGLYLIWIMGIHMIGSKKSSLEEKLFAVMILVIVAITPLGSNNYTFQNLNNLFLVAPFGLYAFVKIYRRKVNHSKWKGLEFAWKSVVAVLGAMILIQSIGFHSEFVFRDGMDGTKRDYTFAQPEVVAGMKTTEKNGRELSELMDYIEKNSLNNEKVILYGDCPGLAFLLNMPVAVGSAWPDLDSYGLEVFRKELKSLKEKPVIIMKKQEYMGEQATLKKEDLEKFIQEQHYSNAYGSENYRVYVWANRKQQ